MNRNISDAANLPEPTPKRRLGSVTQTMPVSRTLPSASTYEHVMKPMAFMPSSVKNLRQLYRQDDPTRMVPEAVNLLRQHLTQQIGVMLTPCLNRFVRTFLADDEVVESYYTHKVREDELGRTFAQRGRLLTAMPWVEAKRAAVLATRCESVRGLQHEQVMAWVAAWAFPSGLFHLCHPCVKQTGVELSDLVQARNETSLMVEDAVIAMRRLDSAAGDTLGAILGTGYDDGTDPKQLARLGTALHLSQRHINSMWVPPSGWAHQN